MKSLYTIFICLVIAGSIFPIGCTKQEGTILATVGNRVITLEDYKGRVSKLPPYYQDIVKRDKRKFLEDIIVQEIFYEEAIRRGLDKDKEIREVIKAAKKKIYMAKLIKNEVEDRISVTEDMIRQYYEEHKEGYKTPHRWRASHILVSTEEEAKSALEELSRGASFEELARKVSKDNAARRGGDIGYFTRRQLLPEFEEACLKLKVGELSPVVKTQFGYHIIKMTDEQPPKIESFENMRSLIQNELRKEQRKELFNNLVMQLKASYNVKVEEDGFKLLEEKSGDE